MNQADPLPTNAPAAPAPSDRRRAERRRITGVTGTRRSPGDLTVLDLSLTGLAAEAIGEIAPGERCFVELVHQGHRVNVEAVVRWASVTRVERSADRFIPVFRTGLSFVAVDRDEAGGIWDWILPEPHPLPEAAS